MPPVFSKPILTWSIVATTMKHSLLLIVVSVSLGVVGQLSLKVGMNQVGVIDAASLAGPADLLDFEG